MSTAIVLYCCSLHGPCSERQGQTSGVHRIYYGTSIFTYTFCTHQARNGMMFPCVSRLAKKFAPQQVGHYLPCAVKFPRFSCASWPGAARGLRVPQGSVTSKPGLYPHCPVFSSLELNLLACLITHCVRWDCIFCARHKKREYGGTRVAQTLALAIVGFTYLWSQPTQCRLPMLRPALEDCPRNA